MTADDPEVLTSTGVEVTQEMWDSLVAENERLRAELAKQSDWNTAEFDRFGTPPIQEKP